MQSPSSSVAAQTCAHCGAAVSTRFCGECGRPVAAAPVAENARALLAEGAGELLGWDRRIVATARDLLLHPVRLAEAHLTGQGAGAYLQPVRTFFLLCGVYILFLSLVQPFSFETILAQVRTDQAAAARALFEQQGIALEVAAERFQQRMNTAYPLVAALILLPLAGVARLLARGRRFRDHLVWLVCFSSSTLMVGLLGLPLGLVSQGVHSAVVTLGAYAYLGVGFFHFARAATRTRTALRFAAFVAADLALTWLAIMMMTAIVFVTVVFV
jgi:Protein of unknown function (DUF3667)